MLLLVALAAAIAVARPWSVSAVVNVAAIGRNPAAIAVDEQTGRAFVASTVDNSISVLDSGSGALLRTVRVGANPVALAVDTRTRRLFVGNYGDDTVSVLDAGTGRLLRTERVNGAPAALVTDAGANLVIVAALLGQSISVLDARDGRLLRVINTPLENHYAIAVDDSDRRAAAITADHVGLLDLRTERVLSALILGDTPLAIATIEAAHQFAVTAHLPNSTHDLLGIVDAVGRRVVRVYPVGRDPFRVVAAAHSGRIVVANNADGTITLIATAGAAVSKAQWPGGERTISVGADPVDIAVDERTDRAFIANRMASSLSVVNLITGTLVRTVALAGHPQAIGVDERRGRVIVATTGGSVALDDPWRWVPRGMRRWLPFQSPRTRTVSPSAVVLDEARL